MTKNPDFTSQNEYLISVIVPIYNSEKFLDNCIKKILAQTYKNIELILINDGSNDSSGKICDDYALCDSRVISIHTKNNGPSVARNIGIKKSTGYFVFFVDSDDFIEKNTLEILSENYKKTNADLIVCDFKIIHNNKSLYRFLFSKNTLLLKPDIVRYVRSYLKKPTGYSLFVYSWGKLFKSSIIKANKIYFDSELRNFEDLLFNFEYLIIVNSVSYVKQHCYNYFFHNNLSSATAKIFTNPLGFKIALKSIQKLLTNEQIDHQLVQKEIGHAYVSFTIRTLVWFFSLSDNHVDTNFIYRIISNLITDINLRQNLKYYKPSGKDSRILPILIKFKLVLIIILVCRIKCFLVKAKDSQKR